MVRPAQRPIPELGRSQVVRQWILIPPFPGSNPGAPASHSRVPAVCTVNCGKHRAGGLRGKSADPNDDRNGAAVLTTTLWHACIATRGETICYGSSLQGC